MNKRSHVYNLVFQDLTNQLTFFLLIALKLFQDEEKSFIWNKFGLLPNDFFSSEHSTCME